MAWDNDPYARSIITDLAKFKPLGDFLLVKPFTQDEQLAMEDRRIAPSPIQMTRDGRYVANRPRGLRYGRVLACGAGDKGIVYDCECGASFGVVLSHSESQTHRCPHCKSSNVHAHWSDDRPEVFTWRAPLGCTIGDVILFPRVPANEISINGEEFVLIHEEQHCVAVIEELEAVAA